MKKANISEIRNSIRYIGRNELRQAKSILKKSGILNSGRAFETGTGKKHYIKKCEDSVIYVDSGNKTKMIAVPEEKVIKMIAFFSRIRIIDRQELEAFFNYNSLMFGLLLFIFKDKVKKLKLGMLLRLVMKGIRVYYAGGDRSKRDLKLLSEYGAQYVLFSYYNIRDNNAWKKYLISNNLKMILDSGAFSEWNAAQKGKSIDKAIDIDEYIQFIKENTEFILAYFNFDVVKDYKKTKANYNYMLGKGLSPIPVYHKGSPIEELDQLVADKHKIIGLGGTVNSDHLDYYFEYLFNRYPYTYFHGLGVTKAEYLIKYDNFLSVDSTAWIRCRTDKIELTRDGQRYKPYITFEERLKNSVSFLKSLENPFIKDIFKRALFKYEQIEIMLPV